jgi:flagellar biosynthesis protein FlhG
MRSYNPLSVRYIQRLKFYREIRGLDADVIIIDLGAGSGLNTIDSFLLADRMILISTPEITSIENLYIFVKKIIIRKIKDMLSYDGFSEYEKEELASDLTLKDALTFTDFIEKLRGLGERQARIVDMGLASLKVNIVLNQLKNRKFLKYGISLKSVLKRHFKINALYSGYVNYDERVNLLANGDMDILGFFNSPEIRQDLKNLADNIKNEKDINFNELIK